MNENSTGKKIEQRRKEKGLSQRQLAKLCDMYQPDIAAIENGRRTNFTVETLKKLSDALDIEIGELL